MQEDNLTYRGILAITAILGCRAHRPIAIFSQFGTSWIINFLKMFTSTTKFSLPPFRIDTCAR
ncbi:hypothetical protein ACHAXM_000106 [Skeletonema potamos]